MNIIVHAEDKIAAERLVSISDDGYDGSGWVTVRVGSELQQIHIDDLHHACIALYSRYRSRMEEEK